MDRMEAIKVLSTEECRCGARKVKRMAFCKQCYLSLPPEMQKALRAWVGEGFEESYEIAAEFLEESMIDNFEMFEVFQQASGRTGN